MSVVPALNGNSNLNEQANSALAPTAHQQRVEDQRKLNRMIGITLIAIAVILLLGAIIASAGAAAGALPAGIALANAFFGAMPPVLIAALYMLKDGGGGPTLNSHAGISLGLGAPPPKSAG